MKSAKATRSIKNNSEILQVTISMLMILIAVLAFFASVSGIINGDIYNELLLNGTMSDSLVFGSVVQDIISIPSAMILMILSVYHLRKRNQRNQILMLGLTAYFLYGYGLYTIQGQYTGIYFIYLAIFGLSFYSLILGIIILVRDSGHTVLPKSVRYSNGIFIGIILLVLVPAWIGRMSPDILRRAPSEIYGVFVLDMALVFPALGIIAYGLIRGINTYYTLAGIALVKTFTLCLSVALGEWIKPYYGFSQDMTMIIMFSSLTLISAILGSLYFLKVDFKA